MLINSAKLLYDDVLTHITNGLDIPILAIYNDECHLGKLGCKEEKKIISLLRNFKKNYYINFWKIGGEIHVEDDWDSYYSDTSEEDDWNYYEDGSKSISKKEININFHALWVEIKHAINRPYFSVEYTSDYLGLPGNTLIEFDSNREIFTDGDFIYGYGAEEYNQDSRLTALVRKAFCPVAKIDVYPTLLQVIIPPSCKDLWPNVGKYVLENLPIENFQE